MDSPDIFVPCSNHLFLREVLIKSDVYEVFLLHLSVFLFFLFEGVEGEISLFDVPLHFNMHYASIDENYDLTKMGVETCVFGAAAVVGAEVAGVL